MHNKAGFFLPADFPGHGARRWFWWVRIVLGSGTPVRGRLSHLQYWLNMQPSKCSVRTFSAQRRLCYVPQGQRGQDAECVTSEAHSLMGIEHVPGRGPP